MSKMAGAGPWAVEFCKSLGLDSHMTHGITLRVYPNEAVSATIEIYIDSENTDVLEVIKKCAWIEEPKPIQTIGDEFDSYVKVGKVDLDEIP